MSTTAIIRSMTKTDAFRFLRAELGVKKFTSYTVSHIRTKAVIAWCREMGIVASQKGFADYVGSAKLFFITVEEDYSQLQLRLKLDNQSKLGRFVCIIDSEIVDASYQAVLPWYDLTWNQYENRRTTAKALPNYDSHAYHIEWKEIHEEFKHRILKELLTRLPEPKFSEMEKPKR